MKLYEALPESLRWRLVWALLHELKVEASVAQDKTSVACTFSVAPATRASVTLKLKVEASVCGRRLV